MKNIIFILAILTANAAHAQDIIRGGWNFSEWRTPNGLEGCDLENNSNDSANVSFYVARPFVQVGSFMIIAVRSDLVDDSIPRVVTFSERNHVEITKTTGVSSSGFPDYSLEGNTDKIRQSINDFNGVLYGDFIKVKGFIFTGHQIDVDSANFRSLKPYMLSCINKLAL